MEFEPARVEPGDLLIEGGRIRARAANLEPRPQDEVVDVSGRIVFPGLVNAHLLPHATLTRAWWPTQGKGKTFIEQLEAGPWRVEEALDGDAVYAGAAASAHEALRCGTTTAFAQHASPSCVEGSLERVARGFDAMGLRGVVSYAISDRYGEAVRDAALAETQRVAAMLPPRFRVRVGIAASFLLSAEGLAAIATLRQQTKLGAHIVLGEDVCDERLTQETFGVGLAERFAEAGMWGPQTLAAHGTQLSWPELSTLQTTGAWLVHCPRSNAHQMRGFAPTGKFGPRATLGTASFHSDLFAEAQAAALRSREAEQPIDLLHYLANGHRVASLAFGAPVGPLREGALADLVISDYQPTTPIDAASLSSHVLEALGARHVEAVMVDGLWRIWQRRSTAPEAQAFLQAAAESAAAVNARIDAATSG